MDIARPDLKRQKTRRTVIFGTIAVLVAAGAAFFVMRLKPAVPTVDSPVWTDTVKRGELLRQVRGPGSLVPREDKIRRISARTEATVSRILVLPGSKVEPDTVIMDLVDPTVRAAAAGRAARAEGRQADLRTRAPRSTAT